MGDFNAKVVRGKFEDIVGEYGLGLRNDRGDRLQQFCQEKSMTIMNTWFRLPTRRLYTWKSPQDNLEHCVRNQVDYIMINRRFKNGIKGTKTYPGADVPSDHSLLAASFKLTLKAIKKSGEKQRIDLSLLRENGTRQRIKQELNENCRKMREEISDEFEAEDVDTLSNKLELILKKSEEHLKGTA
ncbi:craniofacial development protein 2-like [Harmonia axyridis]|uniref:craniofacial development protein 2-like n=1 Tax=Harmonia axyridis TaxID=115357 RepID=UPI001E275A67|nr:craniofacial development protein 2-like [Harmonia axyridis]